MIEGQAFCGCFAMSRASLPALLTTELALPSPVSRDLGEDSTSAEGCSPTARIADLKAFKKTAKVAVSPYQALPVQGPLVTVAENPAITHHLTPALPVLEPEDASRKVFLDSAHTICEPFSLYCD